MKTKSKVAFFWDESFLWGLMAYKSLKANSLPFELLRAPDIKEGRLSEYGMLFVPGGWASNKMKALGEGGLRKIREFVESGGNYLGFCGGAGLATLDGIGLLNIKRKPTKERVPSFSGRINLRASAHPIWKGIPPQPPLGKGEISLSGPTLTKGGSRGGVFHAWWPSQFVVNDTDIKILAAYGEALPESFSSDLSVGDIATDSAWSELEGIYGINLNPKRLLDDPAIVEGVFGKGRVILSLIHFDNPDDRNGAAVLRNLWSYLTNGSNELQVTSDESKNKNTDNPLLVTRYSLLFSEIETAISELISLGMRNFLWFWRNPMLLQWRRGIRGLEYCTLYILAKEIAILLKTHDNLSSKISVEDHVLRIKELFIPFVEKAGQLLVRERLALQAGHITYERCDDPGIRQLRNELFSNSKSYGGPFKSVIDELDSLLYSLLKR